MLWHFILRCSELKVYGNPDIVHLSGQVFSQIINYMYTGKNINRKHRKILDLSSCFSSDTITLDSNINKRLCSNRY